MTKTEFDAALYAVFGTRTLVEITTARMAIHGLRIVPAEPVAWINHSTIVRDGEIIGHGIPELNFTRLAYGYDWSMSQQLFADPEDSK